MATESQVKEFEQKENPFPTVKDSLAEEEVDLGFDTEPTYVAAADTTNGLLEAYENAPEEVTDDELKALENGHYDNALKALDEPIVDPEVAYYGTDPKYIQQHIDSNQEPDTGLFANNTGRWDDNVGDYLAAIRQGVWDTGEQFGFTIAELADWAANKIDGKREDKDAFRNWAQSIDIQDPAMEAANLKRLDNAGKQFTKTAAQFVAGFIPILKATKLLSMGAKLSPKMRAIVEYGTGGGIAGVATDFAAFDQADGRISDMAAQLGAEIEAKEYLKDPNADTFDKLYLKMGQALNSKFINSLRYDKEKDSYLEGRTKQAIEGGLVGTFLMPIMGVITKYARFRKQHKDLRKDAAYNEDGTLKRNERQEPELEVDAERLADKQRATRQDAPLEIETHSTKLNNASQKEFNKIVDAGDMAGASSFLGKKLAESTHNILDTDSIDAFVDMAAELAENSFKRSSSKSWEKAANKAGPKYSKIDPNNSNVRIAALQDEATDMFGNIKPGYRQEIDSLNKLTTDLDVNEFKRSVIREAVGEKLLKAVDGWNAKAISDKEFDDAFATAFTVDAVASEGTSNIARALAQRKLFTRGGSVNTGKIMKGVNAHGYNSRQELADLITKISKEGTNQDVAKAVNALAHSNWKDVLVEIFINSVLSTTSLGVNITSNTLMLLARTAEIHGAAFRNRKMLDEAGNVVNSGVTHRQAFAQSMALMGGLWDAAKVMAKSWWDDAPAHTGKVEGNLRGKFNNEFAPPPAITSKRGALGSKANPETYIEKAWATTVDTFGKILRGQPGAVRSMMASDEFFKVLHYRAEVRRLAVESAEKAGINPTKNPIEFNKHVNDIVNNAKDSTKGGKYSGISREAMDDAHARTFTERFSESGEKLYRSIRQYPLASLILPFVRQPINNLKWYARRTPGLNMIANKLSEDIAAGGTRAEIAKTQLQLGGMIWVSAFIYAASHDDMRGTDKNLISERDENTDLGIDKYTKKNEKGDYYTYRGYEPFAPQFAIASTIMKQWFSLISDYDDDQISDRELGDLAMELGMIGALSTLDAFKDGSAVRAPEQLLKLLDLAGGTDPERWMNTFGHMMAGWLTPFAGNIKYYHERFGNADVRHETVDFGDKWLERYAQAEIPRLNSFGRPMPRANPIGIAEASGGDEDNILNFIPTNIRKTKAPFNTKAELEIIRLKERSPGKSVIGAVPKRIDNVKIDGAERHNLLVFASQFTDKNGDNLDQGLTRIIESERYQSSPIHIQREWLRGYYQGRMEVAKVMLLTDALQASRGLPRSLAKDLNLVDYNKKDSLATIALRSRAREVNKFMHKTDPKYINIDEFVNMTEEKLLDRAPYKLESLLQNN